MPRRLHVYGVMLGPLALPCAGPFLAGLRARAVVGWIVPRHRALEVVAGLLLITVAVIDLVDTWPDIAASLGG